MQTQEELYKEEKLVLQLYVSGMSQKSMEAIRNIKELCTHLQNDAYELQIIDIYKNPHIAVEQQIIFSPSLIKKSPAPKRILIGNLSDKEKVSRTLGIDFKD